MWIVMICCYMYTCGFDFCRSFSQWAICFNNSKFTMIILSTNLDCCVKAYVKLMFYYFMWILTHQTHYSLCLSNCIDCSMSFHHMNWNEILFHVNILYKFVCSWWCTVYPYKNHSWRLLNIQNYQIVPENLWRSNIGFKQKPHFNNSLYL